MNKGSSITDEIVRLRALCTGASSDRPEVANNLGCLLLSVGQTQEAVRWLSQATRLDPKPWEFHRNLAAALAQAGRRDDALQSLRMAQAAEPGLIDALLPLLEALLAQGALAEAASHVGNFIKEKHPNMHAAVALRNLLNTFRPAVVESAELLRHWATLERQLGISDAAASLIDMATARWPNDPENWRARAHLHADLGQLPEAVDCFATVTRLIPKDWAAWNDGGCCLRAMGRSEEARTWMYRGTLGDPNNSTLHANLALIDFELNDYDACAKHLDDAFACDPRNPEAMHTKAMLLAALGHHTDAEAMERETLAIKPDYPSARLGLALALLMRGNFKEGFSGYESRWVGSDRAQAQSQPTIGRPQWHGHKTLPGSCIAILPEQGFGDNLQFARFVPRLLAHFQRVVWRVPNELVILFQASFSHYPAIEVVPAISAAMARQIDFELPLMSLPLVLQIDLPDLPGPMPYLNPPVQQRRRWQDKLVQYQGLKVGIAWQGRPTLSKNALRNCPPELFASLALPGVQLVSLQKNADAVESLDALPLANECANFAETAGLVANLDLVISVDTAVVHLAGALGVPVWLLNRLGSEWRWMADREDSPWYPSMRIFNQVQLHDWRPTMERIAQALSEQVSSRSLKKAAT